MIGITEEATSLASFLAGFFSFLQRYRRLHLAASCSTGVGNEPGTGGPPRAMGPHGGGTRSFGATAGDTGERHPPPGRAARYPVSARRGDSVGGLGRAR